MIVLKVLKVLLIGFGGACLGAMITFKNAPEVTELNPLQMTYVLGGPIVGGLWGLGLGISSVRKPKKSLPDSQETDQSQH